MKKILFIDNTAHHLYGQLHNLFAMRNIGFQVEAFVPNDGNYFTKISNLGFKCHNDIRSWRGINIFRELYLFFSIYKVIRRVKPDLIFSFTIKPNLYGAIVARNVSIPIVTNITGLGALFMSGHVLTNCAIWLYKYSFKNVQWIFFQNQDDLNLFKKFEIINKISEVSLLPGSGVNLEKFEYVGIKHSYDITFLFSGRLLWDKGLGELIEAMRKVKKKYPMTNLKVMGNYFLANPSGISASQINDWISEGLIKYFGMVYNVFEIIADCDCVILPSYREGMPRSLLEASSMGKPIITVDSIGCKDVVEDGVTGYMAKVKDVDSLADAMIKFIELPFGEKVEMGLNGRRKMEREFDQKLVIQKYLEVAEKFVLNS